MSIPPRPTDETTQPRESGLFPVPPRAPAPIDRHYYVPDPATSGSYCLACNLPLYNIRHVARPGAAA